MLFSPSPPQHMAMRFVNLGRIAHHLPSLEQEDFVLAHLKVDIVHAVILHGVRKVRSHNAMPTFIVLLVKFPSYILCHILIKVMFEHSEARK